LDSAGTDFLFGLDDSNDDVTFGFSSNAFGPVGTILTLENDLNSTSYPGVGIWKLNPSAALHVGSHDRMSAQLKVENNLAPAKGGDVVMLDLTNPGNKAVGLTMNAGGSIWQISNSPAVNRTSGANSGEFRISKLGAKGVEFSVNGFGDGRFLRKSIATQHVNVSSRRAKTDFEAVDEKSVLQKLASLPISTWRYRADAPDGEHKHVGPVAEDFQRTFGWSDGNHISTVDANGVALAEKGKVVSSRIVASHLA